MKIVVLIVTGCACALAVHLLAQGELHPMDPPGPTMKTLAQVEPRIPIDPANTPGTGGSTYEISRPGSYYLTGDLAGTTGKIGLVVQASNVFIALFP